MVILITVVLTIIGVPLVMAGFYPIVGMATAIWLMAIGIFYGPAGDLAIDILDAGPFGWHRAFFRGR